MCRFSWMRANLVEFRIKRSSLFCSIENLDIIYPLLQNMFTKGCCDEEVSFPKLYWLAIDISPDMGVGLKQVLSDAYLVADTRRLRENIISLPDETIRAILEYTLPQRECQRLEWIGILSRTCKSFREISQGFAPKIFMLLDYVSYDPIVRPRSFNARVGILKSIHKFSWMRANLEEFHVSRASILCKAKKKQKFFFFANCSIKFSFCVLVHQK